MQTKTIKGLTFGDGMPKICIPLTGKGLPAVLSELSYASAQPCDLYEWRADCFYGGPSELLHFLTDKKGERPLLCTIRTKREGGNADYTPEAYENAVAELLETGLCDLIDVELSCGEERVKRLVRLARERDAAVVLSKHNFEQTPPKEEIEQTLVKMAELGADLPKYAAMPRTPRDVLALLTATLDASEQIGPVITMSMGALGRITRAGGALFGSCLTFAAGVNSSAPGQIDAEDLSAILEDLLESV